MASLRGEDLNLPNTLTLLRVLTVPVFIYFLSSPTPFNLPLGDRALAAALIFFLASITDWLDGYLARRWRQVTTLGKLLDPLADKLLVAGALISLVELRGPQDQSLAPAWMVFIILAREFAITGLRGIASEEGLTIPAGTAPSLTFWLNVVSSETTTTIQYDKLYVEVTNTSGTVLATLATFSNLNKGTAGVYSQKGPYSLSAYAGQTVRVRFRGTTDSSLITTFRIDDASAR